VIHVCDELLVVGIAIVLGSNSLTTGVLYTKREIVV
jgi:hypothetical protein